jgi:hypothetical protein
MILTAKPSIQPERFFKVSSGRVSSLWMRAPILGLLWTGALLKVYVLIAFLRIQRRAL